MTIKTHITEDEGKLIVNKTQDVEPLLNHINHLRNADLKTTYKAYAHYQRKKLIKVMQLRKKKNHLRVVK